MNEQIEVLIASLREELQQYGEMLALLDQQQQLVMDRATGKLLENLAAVNAQSSVIQVARQQREQRQRELNAALQLPAEAPFRELTRVLPEPSALLLNALVDEINQCLHRVHKRARQNHLLLSRSVEMIQRLVATLFPSSAVTTYSPTGRVASAPVAGSGGLCEVLG